MKTPKLEVLAPAGDWEQLQAAVRFGADAVYLGSNYFTMRAAPENFGGEQLAKAVEYAHSNHVPVYLTCNTLPRGEELAQLPDFFKNAVASKVDALIINDIGVLEQARLYAPEIAVHISTQAGIVNHLTANAFYKMGARRIVLARELSLKEIAYIRENTPADLEIEAFVHGAMCVSVSGRCLLSEYFLQRDANRGACAQPCRWGYYLMEEKRPGEYFPIFEDERGSYILNAKDMCMIEHIDKLAACGITSLKIEGRAKSAYYTAVVTNAYRHAVDLYYKDPAHYKAESWMLEEVQKVSHRRYTTGFFFGPPPQGQYYENGGYLRTYDVVMVVEKSLNGRVYGTQKNKFSRGDTVEILQPKSEPFSYTITALFNSSNEEIDVANHAAEEISFICERNLTEGTILRKLR